MSSEVSVTLDCSGIEVDSNEGRALVRSVAVPIGKVGFPRYRGTSQPVPVMLSSDVEL